MTANKNNVPEFSELSLFDISPSLASFLPEDFCTSNQIALLDDPSSKDTQNIRVGVLDIEDQDLIAKAQEIIGEKIKPVQLNDYEISKALSLIYNIEADSNAGPNLQLNSSSEIDFSKDRKPNLILQDILSAALQRRATDIHIENYNEDVDMRLRIDGNLHQVTTSLSPSNIQRVIACLKIVCDLDHLERKKSQDGRFSAQYDDGEHSRKIDFRASIVPGNHGQEAVIRVLDPHRFILDINELGMPANILNSYKRIVNYPNGLILTTGPTSSGKTSTLYATVQSLVNRGLKIMTAEDPVEYEMNKVNQKSIDEFMDFSDYIRSFLRQNPIFTASLLPQTAAGAYALGKGTLKSIPGLAKSYVDAVLPGDQSSWWKEPEIVEKKEEIIEKPTVKKLTEAEKKLIEETKKKNAKLARDKRVDDLLEVMGYDKAKKTAAYDALIDAGQTILQRGTLDKKNIGRELIDPIVERTSKRFDKPEQIREAVGLMMTKGEIEKDIAKGKGGQLQQNARDLVAGGVFPDMASALDHLAKKPSLREKAITFAQGMKKGGIDQEVVISTIHDEFGEIPKVLVDETEMEKERKKDTFTSDIATFTELVKAQDLGPGYYVIGDSGFVIDSNNKIKQLL